MKRESFLSPLHLLRLHVDDNSSCRPLSKLHELSIEGDYPALEAFLSSEQGKASQIDQRDSYGYSALHLATDRGESPLLLLD